MVILVYILAYLFEFTGHEELLFLYYRSGIGKLLVGTRLCRVTCAFSQDKANTMRRVSHSLRVWRSIRASNRQAGFVGFSKCA